jgi:putative spermidine/putrescine transport system substrate-binding protein
MMRNTGLALSGLAVSLLASLAAHADPVRIYSYSGVFEDNYTATVVQPFAAANPGTTPQYVSGDTSAAMLGALRTQKTAPQTDVVIMDTTTAAIACAEGLVEPLTPAMLPVLDEIDKQARDAGGACGPGVTFDHLVVVYDTKAVQPAPTSLHVLWDPKWKGRIGIDAPPNIIGLGLTAVLAHEATGDWKNADSAFALLKQLAPSVQTFAPQPDPYSLILNDTLTLATGWNARGQLYHDRSQGRLGVMLPKEGTVFQINTINLVKGGPNRAGGLAFIAYALSAPAQKAFTERMFYAPTNTKAVIAPAAAERTAAAPDNKARVIPLDWTDMLKLREGWNQRWRRDVISASGR